MALDRHAVADDQSVFAELLPLQMFPRFGFAQLRPCRRSRASTSSLHQFHPKYFERPRRRPPFSSWRFQIIAAVATSNIVLSQWRGAAVEACVSFRIPPG